MTTRWTIFQYAGLSLRNRLIFQGRKISRKCSLWQPSTVCLQKTTKPEKKKPKYGGVCCSLKHQESTATEELLKGTPWDAEDWV